MSDKPKFTPVHSAIDNVKLALSEKPLQKGWKGPRLRMGFWGNNPRIEVLDGNPDGNFKEDLISANMDLPTLNQMLIMMRHCVQSNGPLEYAIDNYIGDRVDGKFQKTLVSTTLYGQSDDGRMYISVKSTNERHPYIKFYMHGPFWHEVRYADGRELPPADESKFFTQGWLTMMTQVVNAIAVSHHQHLDWSATKSQNGHDFKPDNDIPF